MDEIKQGAVDPPQPSAEQTPGDKGETTPPKTYTEAEYKKGISDTKAEAGRVQKTLSDERDALSSDRDAVKQELFSANDRIDELQNRIDQMEEDATGSDPDLQKALRLKKDAEAKVRNLEKKEQDISKREAQVKADTEAISQSKLEVTIWEVAQKYGADPVKLKELNFQTKEQMEAYAEAVGTKNEPPETPKPDSGMTIGGAAGIETLEKANKDFAEGKITEEQLREVREKVK